MFPVILFQGIKIFQNLFQYMIFGHLPTEAACSSVSAEASLILHAEHAGIMRGGRAVEQVELRFDSQS